MSWMRKAAAFAATGTLALALAGCISVFPKTKPAMLYRFGAPPAQGELQARPTVLIKGPVEFNRAAASDRILTSDGATVAYIAGARWITPAASLFNDALERAYEAPAAPMLVGRQRASAETPVLALDVTTFETRYQGGLSPTVVVEVRADLIRPADRATLAEKTFRAETPAADNRVGPIVQAYDASVAKVTGELVAWSAGYAGPAPGR